MIQLILIIKVKEQTNKQKNTRETKKVWHDYIINDEAQPGKNSTLYNTLIL